MSEWITMFKLGVVTALTTVLIAVVVGFTVTGEIIRTRMINNTVNLSNMQNLFQPFNDTWLDSESATQLAWNCIGKPVKLKIDTSNSGLKEVKLDVVSARKEIERYVDRNRFYIRIIETNQMMTVYLDKEA